jgi:hypothetical protein
MGMYDYVEVESSISLTNFPCSSEGVQFQTKDFDQTMSVYKITSKGRLQKMKMRCESVPEDERPSFENSTFKDTILAKITGIFRTVSEGWVDENFHGTFTFYTHLENNWYTYKAKFTDGKLVSITPELIETELRY